jgi:hypothetical protein
MSCECYTIGGPWVTYDPNCPKHGDDAREEEKRIDLLEKMLYELKVEQKLCENRIDILQKQTYDLTSENRNLRGYIRELEITTTKLNEGE